MYSCGALLRQLSHCCENCSLQEPADIGKSDVVVLVTGWADALVGLQRPLDATKLFQLYLKKVEELDWTPVVRSVARVRPCVSVPIAPRMFYLCRSGVDR